MRLHEAISEDDAIHLPRPGPVRVADHQRHIKTKRVTHKRSVTSRVPYLVHYDELGPPVYHS